MLIDSHAHLSASDFDEDLDNVLARAQEAKIVKIFNICTSPEEFEKGLLLHERYPWIENIGATTPHDVENVDEAVFSFFERQVHKGLMVAIGETGLDYHYEYVPREEQKKLFRRYLLLAKESHLPIVIHCREAFEDLYRIFDEENYKGKVLLHCFTGTLAEAEEAVRRGYMISLSGIVTFKKSISLQQVAQSIPLSHMLIETDCPYLSPEGYRGKRNEPAFIHQTAQFLASLKNIDSEVFMKTTMHNTLNFFK